MKRWIAFVLAAVLVLSLVPVLSVDAASYNLAQLLQQDRIKPLGRTAVNPAGTGIMCDWPGNGFEMHVSGGGTLQITVSTNYAANWAVLVDGEQVYWERLSASGGTISASIPAGSHLVSVIKESDNQGKSTDYCDLTTLTYGGSIASRPADKDLRIEFIGDSYTAGWGTLGEYTPGVSWTNYHHSFTHGFAWYCAQMLNADYTIAARGGIGLFDGVSAEQPDDDPDATIQDIYPYTAGFRTSAGLYDFQKQADIVVVHLGANDTIKESDANFTSAKWREHLENLTDTIRANQPDAAIVYVNHRAQKYKIMKSICEDRAATDSKLYALSFSHQGNGSGGSTQYYGHPDAADSYELAQVLANFLRSNDLTGKAQEPTYSDMVYYATESGSDSADGKTLATAKKSIYGALSQAKADNATFPAGSRVVVKVEGTVLFNSKVGTTQSLADVGQLTTEDGKKLPILLTTNNYTGTKAVLDTSHSTASANSHLVYFCNDMTLKDIVFQSTTHAHTDKTTRDYRLYAGYNDIVFDNVTFAQAGDAPTTENYTWQLSAGHILGTTPRPETATSSSMTFKNGDYTNVGVVTTTVTNSLTGSVKEAPTIHVKIVIEDGAKMGTVHNRYGMMTYGSHTVEVRGGYVGKYQGTADGNSTTAKNYKGNVNFVMTGGKVGGNEFLGAGRYVNIDGDVVNTISGGTIEIRPTANTQTITFGPRQNSTVKNVTNHISGGQFHIVSDVENVKSGYYFGGVSSVNISGRITNHISGGSFVPLDGKAATAGSYLYFGIMSGGIAGGLYNNISGGSFDTSASTKSGVYMGVQNVNILCPTIVNVIGDKETGKGPMFNGAEIRFAGGWSTAGMHAVPTAMPGVSQCSDKVVISNTVYGGQFAKAVYFGPTGVEDMSKSYYTFVLGSIENNIYGGMFQGTVWCAGSSDVYGKVTTNIHGGVIANLYAAGVNAAIYDGVQLNIYGMQEYYKVYKANTWAIRGGSYQVDVPAPQTAGRPSVLLTVAPEGELTLNTPLSLNCVTGSVLGAAKAQVFGGTYPKGFSIAGTTVQKALGAGCVIEDASGKQVNVTGSMTTTGTAQVTVKKLYDTYRMDVNGDGKVTIFDAQMLIEAEKGLRTLTPEQASWVGTITAQQITDAILGKESIV